MLQSHYMWLLSDVVWNFNLSLPYRLCCFLSVIFPSCGCLQRFWSLWFSMDWEVDHTWLMVGATCPDRYKLFFYFLKSVLIILVLVASEKDEKPKQYVRMWSLFPFVSRVWWKIYNDERKRALLEDDKDLFSKIFV